MDIEQIPDKPRCEMCGAILTPDGPDRPERIAAETLRELAAIAQLHPTKATLILEWYGLHAQNCKQSDLALKYDVSYATVKRWLREARERLSL